MPNSDDVSRSAFLLYHVSTCAHIYTRCNWPTGPLIILSLIMPEKETDIQRNERIFVHLCASLIRGGIFFLFSQEQCSESHNSRH